MKKSVIFGLTILVLSSLQPAAVAQRMMEISGKVVNIFGDKFVLDTGTEKILVDAELNKIRNLRLDVGEQISVYGEYDDDDFDAYSLTRANGSQVQVRFDD